MPKFYAYVLIVITVCFIFVLSETCHRLGQVAGGKEVLNLSVIITWLNKDSINKIQIQIYSLAS